MAADGGALVEGAKSISRAVHVLRLLTRRGTEGTRLKELTRASGLPHSTVRRILLCLIAERLVLQDADTRRYHLGPLNLELGLATQHRLPFRERLRPSLERIARLSEDTVHLNMRGGFDLVSIDRIDGTSPIRAVTFEIGGRRPLSFGASGQAMMAALSDEEVEIVLHGNAKDIDANPRLNRQSLRDSIERTRERGYGIIRDTTVIGISAVGVAVPASGDTPEFGVAVAMVNERLTPERARWLHQVLRDELGLDG